MLRNPKINMQKMRQYSTDECNTGITIENGGFRKLHE